MPSKSNTDKIIQRINVVNYALLAQLINNKLNANYSAHYVKDIYNGYRKSRLLANAIYSILIERDCETLIPKSVIDQIEK